MNGLIFPKDFSWGTATASYQIEGANNIDGRGECTWDRFSSKPGKTINNDNGSMACDHYNRYSEDINLMKNLGLDAYRFSISWPRILPEGKGKINEKGLDFYDKLLDNLLVKGIEPYITLFHWDLPQKLEDIYGGWRSKEVSKYFSEYAKIVVDKFSDRVSNWITINEIKCFTTLAHREGRHAPGKIEPEQIVNQTIHNALLGHGLAVKRIRANAKIKPNIGIVENLDTTWPVIDTEENIHAAKKAWKDLNQSILFPVMKGAYSNEYLELLGNDAPHYTEDEMKIISEPCDFIGYNYYTGVPVRASKNKKGYEILNFSEDYPKTDMQWPITPKALYYALKFSKEEFNNIPVFITENGMAAADIEEANGEVIDISRVEYIRTHLEMINKAIKEGCDIRGYFVWSLMDNFEWAYGYSKRFGITRVNYSTFERKLKMSGEFYRELIKTNKQLSL
ncbi:MAG: beta-glucosidase [bacterium]|nr:beta-glucosidase [bacterium]